METIYLEEKEDDPCATPCAQVSRREGLMAGAASIMISLLPVPALAATSSGSSSQREHTMTDTTHFIHVRSKHEKALPLLVNHGWPGSIIGIDGITMSKASDALPQDEVSAGHDRPDTDVEG
jgi:hypothetical protein